MKQLVCDVCHKPILNGSIYFTVYRHNNNNAFFSDEKRDVCCDCADLDIIGTGIIGKIRADIKDRIANEPMTTSEEIGMRKALNTIEKYIGKAESEE